MLLSLRIFVYPLQVRGIKTNLVFLDNVLRHPDFLMGEATTSFIEKNSKDLFKTNPASAATATKILEYLANQIVDGPQHPGMRAWHRPAGDAQRLLLDVRQ